MIKTLNKLGIKRNFLNLIKGIYEKVTANINILPNSDRLDVFSLDVFSLVLRISQGCLFSYLATFAQHCTAGSSQGN